MNKKDDVIDDVFALCKSAIYCKLGDFYPDKNFGSRIRGAIGDNKLLLSYTREALSDIDSAYVKQVNLNGKMLEVTLTINEEERQMNVQICT